MAGYSQRGGMARQNEAMARLNARGRERARQLAELIVQEIQAQPRPYDTNRRADRETYEHLKNSYKVKVDPVTGDASITTDVRYWHFVEFGTREHGHAQPHIRPAIELVRREFRR